MADSFQKEKPPARVNLFLEVQEGDAKESVELPLRMLVVGDFTGRADDAPVEERDVLNVNRDNFELVMRDQELGLDLCVPDRLQGSGDEMRVQLRMASMQDFEPDRVARQVPQLRRLLAMRNLLKDLRNRVVSTSQFRRQLEEIVQDRHALDELSTELDSIVQGALPEGSPPEGDGAA